MKVLLKCSFLLSLLILMSCNSINEKEKLKVFFKKHENELNKMSSYIIANYSKDTSVTFVAFKPPNIDRRRYDKKIADFMKDLNLSSIDFYVSNKKKYNLVEFMLNDKYGVYVYFCDDSNYIKDLDNTHAASIVLSNNWGGTIEHDVR